MNLENIEIRQLIEKKRLKYFEIANEMGIDRSTLSRWLGVDLTPEHKKKILDAINRIEI